MQIEAIQELLNQTSTIKNWTDSVVAKNLLCCVLEIQKCNSSEYCRGTQSGYFWEKMDKALKEIGYKAVISKA